MGGFSSALLDRISGPGQAPVAPINPLDQQEKQQAIAESSQAQQLNAQKIEQQKMVLDDQKTLRALQPQFVQKDESGKPTGYDWNGLIAAAQGKVLPATLFGLQKQQSDLRQSMATATKDELANQKEVNGELYQRAEGLKGITDPNERQKHYESTLGWAQQHSVDVSQWPATAPDNDHITALESGFGMHAQALADQKTAADTKSAEAKSLLDAAQAEAANYKEDPNLGLIDLRTKQPVSPNALAPLGPGEAEVLGKKPGDMVPLKLKNTANEIVNRGIHVTSANGRQIMVDGQGNTIKDLGTAPAVVNFNMQNAGAAADASGNPSEIAKAIAENRMKWSEAVSARTPQATKNAIMAQVFKLNPNYDTAEFGLETDAAKKARSGAWADTRVAYNTAIDHADQLLAAADALKNGDVKKLNSLKNYFATQFGSPDVSNFSAIANAYNHEVTGVVAKNHITDAEVAAGHAVLPDKASPDQIKGVAQAYKKLMSSKRDELDKVIRAGAGNKANAVLDVKSNQDQGGGQPTGHKVGDLISQHGRTFKATKVDANGKVLAADPQ
jgi:hypothetical protein